MPYKLTSTVITCLLISFTIHVFAQHPEKQYRLWYDQPTPDLPIRHMDSLNREALIEATPIDPAWENFSLPIGNGYMGASLFGRTGTERIQLTENSMAAKSLYKGVGLTNFGELYIDFNHDHPTGYSRSLSLNNAVSTVQYAQDGIIYKREYFTSYPDKVLVIQLSCNRKGSLSFTLRPEIPYKKEFGAASGNNGRMGTVKAENGLVTLAGKLEYLNLNFEGQFKVLPVGGTMKAVNDTLNNKGLIEVTDADAATIIVAVGTNYKLEPHVFTENNPLKKLTDTTSPHEKVSAIINQAAAKPYLQLLGQHTKDYRNLFTRATVDFGAVESKLTTDQLLQNYRQGTIDHYLEELYFQYGRYLLICSSRPGTLPPNLQGIWSQYDITPWTGGYWHNINIQMNYWPVFSTNLTELFQSFTDYNLAYRKAAESGATQYIRTNNPRMLSTDGDNGWTIGTGASAYNISTPGGHSGPGTGTMTSKLFWDYYEFTGDKNILRNITYPATAGMSKFLSKVVVDTMGFLLTSPSYSPEQRRQGKEHYKTIGCAFDQQMIVESHTDFIKASGITGHNTPFLSLVKSQLPRLDPVQIGWSGQIKEYREEKYYGEIVDPKHRHVSQLIGLYPGTMINSNTPAWLDAAQESLNRRGDKSTGWAMAFRLNLWARTKNGERSYNLFRTLLQKGTQDNLWDTHPPFQIDGNFGGTAGVAEMLLQSHEGYIDLLPALPGQWKNGAFNGLLARGNFEVSAKWSDGQAEYVTIRSNIGGKCRLKYMNIQNAVIKNRSGAKVHLISGTPDKLEFDTKPGDMFNITSIPVHKKLTAPANLLIKENKAGNLLMQWDKSPDAVSYNVYIHCDNAPDYTLIKTKLRSTYFAFEFPQLAKFGYGIVRVTAVDASGRESSGVKVNVEY